MNKRGWRFAWWRRFLCALPFVPLFSWGAETGPAAQEPVYAAYLPAWGVSSASSSELEGAGLTHLIYAFLKPVFDGASGQVELLLDFPGNGLEDEGEGGADRAFAAFRGLADRAGLRKMVSIGGWGSSEHFSDIAATESSRRLFAEKLRNFVVEHELDGADLDWEYPLEGGAEGTVYRADDPANLVKLALAVRRAFERHPGAREKVLTAAVPGGYDALASRYRLVPLSRALDWIHLMAYDFAGPWMDRVGPAAPLYGPGSPPYRSASVAGSVAAMSALGVPRGKIVLGLSLAGVRFDGVEPVDGGWMGAPFASVDTEAALDGWNDYRHLVPTVLYPPDTHDWEIRRDEQAAADYLVSPATGGLVSFESAWSAARKGAFAREQGLRGLMFWSLDKDGPDVPLIRAAIDSAAGAAASEPASALPRSR